MINILCSLQGHRYRSKLCCFGCQKNEDRIIIRKPPYTSSQNEIIHGLINISNLCEQLILVDDFQCLDLWNGIMHTIIDSNYMSVKKKIIQFSELDEVISREEVILQIHEQQTHLMQYMNKRAQNKSKKEQLKLQKKPFHLKIQTYGQQKELIFRKEQFSFETNDKTLLSFVELSLDGTIIAIASDNKIRIWSVQYNRIIQQFQHKFQQYCRIAISQNNQMIAYTGDLDKKLFLRYQQDIYKCATKFNIPLNKYDRIIFYQNDIYILFEVCKNLAAYDVKKDCNLIFPFLNYARKSFSADNKLLAFVNYNGIAQIWNFNQKKRLTQSTVGDRNVGVCFSPSSYMLLTGKQIKSSQIISVWQIVGRQNQLIQLFKINLGNILNALILCFYSDQLILSKENGSGYINIHKTDSRKWAPSLEVEEGQSYAQSIMKSSELNVLIYSCKKELQVWNVQYV